jgi:uncharacterized protein (TIGR03435 family)
MSGCQGGPGGGDPVRVNCEYANLRMLLAKAYGVKTQEVFGPEIIDSEHFNIVAKVPDGASKAQVPAMYRNMLVERFKLAAHRETREMPGYALTVAKGGLKIKAPEPQRNDAPAAERPAGGGLPTGKDGFPILSSSVLSSGLITLYRNGRARMQASSATLAALASAISAQLDRVVVDETGQPGSFAITLYWTPDALEMGGRQRLGSMPESPQEASTPGANLLQAVEQQLGLKLVAKKVPREVVVVDHVEKVPTEN